MCCWFFVEIIIDFFPNYLMKKRVKHNLFDFFFNNANIFTVTYDQFDASLLKKSISFKSIILYITFIYSIDSLRAQTEGKIWVRAIICHQSTWNNRAWVVWTRFMLFLLSFLVIFFLSLTAHTEKTLLTYSFVLYGRMKMKQVWNNITE